MAGPAAASRWWYSYTHSRMKIISSTIIASLPTLLKRGYSPEIATGTICTSGPFGQIIPPMIILFMLGYMISSAYQEAQLAQGSVSYGVNLDGMIDANDLRSSEGVEGIDNQTYRAVGCIAVPGTDYLIAIQYSPSSP